MAKTCYPIVTSTAYGNTYYNFIVSTKSTYIYYWEYTTLPIEYAGFYAGIYFQALTDEAIQEDYVFGSIEGLYARNHNVTVWINEKIQKVWVPNMLKEKELNVFYGILKDSTDTAQYEIERFDYGNVCSSNVECISANCSYHKVSYDLETFTFTADHFTSSETIGSQLYKVKISCGYPYYRTESATFWLKIYSKTSLRSPINIFLPTTEYYQYYRYFRRKGIIKYDMVEPDGYVPRTWGKSK